MSQTTQRPPLVAATTTRAASADTTFRDLINRPRGGFDADAYHVMSERDNALIADEILNGAGSTKFVYAFDISGKSVTGISVIGARHLAAEYGGLRHRIVASTRKSGSLFTFTSYPANNSAMNVSCSTIPELREEDDFYSALVEITDVKKGNSIQMEAAENREERRRDGTRYDRPHYQKIAQAKAYRNAVLALIPQDVQIEWADKMLALGKGDKITESVIGEKRSGVLRFAAANGIPMDRHAVEALTMDQIAGLADAARTKERARFTNAAIALGLVQEAVPQETDVVGATPPETPTRRGPGRPRKADAPPQEAPPPPEGAGRGPRRAAAPAAPPPAAQRPAMAAAASNPTANRQHQPDEPPPASGEDLF